MEGGGREVGGRKGEGGRRGEEGYVMPQVI